MSRQYRQWLLVLVTLASIIAASVVRRMPQDPSYHHFADQRTLFGVPNFWNVFSNLGYLLAGIYGFMRLKRLRVPEPRPAYLTFCVAVALVCLRWLCGGEDCRTLRFGNLRHHWHQRPQHQASGQFCLGAVCRARCYFGTGSDEGQKRAVEIGSPRKNALME
jgi:hypothetical protein